ncbi:MAG: DUF1211 domain-containing protein [Dehalococcoidia bacterium]|nr:DUF1211 domain-containing protein [Dehalococcoidia bacterium]
MGKSRLEAFSDGVLAILILITIMVLELLVPVGDTLEALGPLCGVFLSYTLSFVFLGIYWNNHHHLLHTVEGVPGGVMWANLHLMCWLSLVPFVTGWMGASRFAPEPTAAYGIVMLMAAIAFTVLTWAIIVADGPWSLLRKAISGDRKGLVSLALWMFAAGLAWWAPVVAGLGYVTVAVIWLVPNRRIARMIEERAP